MDPARTLAAAFAGAAPTLAAAFAGAAHAHAPRPAMGGATWGDLARRARVAALGAEAAGLAVGQPVDVAIDAGPDRVVAEMAVVAVGAVLTIHGAGGSGGTARLDRGRLTAAESDGARLDAEDPDRFERMVDAREPGAVAVLSGGRPITSEEAQWGLRSVARWLLPVRAGLGAGEAPVVVGDGQWDEPGAAVLGWWWACLEGGSVHVAGEGGVPAATAGARPHLVVSGPQGWADVAAAVRARSGARQAFGRCYLAAGRAQAAGERLSSGERVALAALDRTCGRDIRTALGLDRGPLAVCLGPVDEASRRDLAAAGVAVLGAWTPPGALVPAVAADPTELPPPSSGRPLPGHTVRIVDGEVRVDRGGRGGGDLATGRRGRLDGQGHLHLDAPRRLGS